MYMKIQKIKDMNLALIWISAISEETENTFSKITFNLSGSVDFFKYYDTSNEQTTAEY